MSGWASAAAFDAVAALLRYPDAGWREPREVAAALAEGAPEAAAAVEAFAARVQGLDRDRLEELYTRTFDLDPACTLDLGWHLYGEAYERGRFLVAMRRLLREHGVEESTELPDHLAHVLPLLGRMAPGEGAELAAVIDPALTAVEEALGRSGNPYRHVITAVRELLAAAFGRPAAVRGAS